MRTSALRSAALAGLATAAVAAGCGGEQQRPYRIGVVTECAGILHTLRGPQLAGAQLPLLRHGGRLRNGDPLAGVAGARVAGRPVEIVPGCTETLEFSTLAQEARRLVENEHVDALVAGSLGADEVILRDIARANPRVSVLAAASGPRELTAGRAPVNFRRVVADESQSAAGLGTYARRELGWRTAAVVYLDWDAGWDGRDAFTAEFCALGGRVVRALPSADFTEGAALAGKVPRGVDGVVVFATPPFDSSALLGGLARRLPDPPRQLLVGAGITADASSLRTIAGALDGVVGSSVLPAPAIPGRAAYRRAYARAFPSLPRGAADGAFVSGYSSAVGALVSALQQAGGRPGGVPKALQQTTTELIGVPTRTVVAGQATVDVHLVRIRRPAVPGGPARLEPVRTVPAVDHSVGGLLPSRYVPTSTSLRCTRRTPPPWAS